MKIILSAFNGMLEGKPMDVPEETGDEFTLRLIQPSQVVCDYTGNDLMSYPTFGTRCHFIRTNQHRPINANAEPYNSAVIYELTRIEKQ